MSIFDVDSISDEMSEEEENRWKWKIYINKWFAYILNTKIIHTSLAIFAIFAILILIYKYRKQIKEFIYKKIYKNTN